MVDRDRAGWTRIVWSWVGLGIIGARLTCIYLSAADWDGSVPCARLAGVLCDCHGTRTFQEILQRCNLAQQRVSICLDHRAPGRRIFVGLVEPVQRVPH